MEEPPFHKFLHISQNHRPVSIIAHASKSTDGLKFASQPNC